MKERGRLGTYARKCWRWSWLVTLPVAVVFCLWAASTARMYYAFKVHYIPTMDLRLKDLGVLQAGLLVNGFKGLMLPGGWVRKKGLPKVHLFVREADLKRLDSDLPYSGRSYVDGKLLYPDGEIGGVSVRYRGDFSYHWSGRKKSLRVKTKKKKLYEGIRHINLIVPKAPFILNNYLSYELAARLGLMAPAPKLVETHINGKYMGVELFVEQPNEQFLRRRGRMPGDLFVGEIVGRDSFPGMPREVFSNPGFWTKAAVNNNHPPEWNEPLKELTRALYNEDMDRVMGLIDLDSWARLAAFMTICQTVHIDAMHNWRLYFDPARGRFYPVVWDPLGWDVAGYVKWVAAQTNRFDIITNIALERLHRDHRFLKAKHDAVEEFFTEGGGEYIMRLLEDTSDLEASISRDRHLHFGSSYLLGPDDVLREIARFKEGVREVLAVVRSAYLETPPEASWDFDPREGRLQVNVKGFMPLKSLEVELARDAGAPGAVKLEYIAGGSVRSRDLTPFSSAAGRVIKVAVPLFAAREMAVKVGADPLIIRDARLRPATYWLRSDALRGRKILRVRAGYADGKGVDLPREEGPGLFPLDGNFYPAPVAAPPAAAVWEGDVTIKGVREVTGNLVMKPGATVRFAPGASLVVTGRLIAEGRPSAPVRFIPASGDQPPWGAVVLTGRGADGSVLRNCTMRGGSGLRRGYVDYSAMLSIHDVRGVEIENCAFADNHLVDDMVHAVYSGVEIRGSDFSGAVADAVDFDYVTGTVEDSRFAASGNDALDLMSSDVAVLGSSMTGSGDKGISVGEGSRVFVWNTRFDDNEIGLQSKDGSRAVLYNTEFTGNRLTMDAYKKNWQYGTGGAVFVYKSRLSGPAPTLTADGDSLVSVYDTYLAGAPGRKKKRIRLDATVDSDLRERARTGEPFGGDDAEEARGLARPYMERIDPKVRGLAGDES